MVPGLEVLLFVPLVAVNPRRMTRQNKWLRRLSLALVMVIAAATCHCGRSLSSRAAGLADGVGAGGVGREVGAGGVPGRGLANWSRIASSRERSKLGSENPGPCGLPVIA